MKRGDRVEWDIGQGQPWSRTLTGRITGMEGKKGPRVKQDDDDLDCTFLFCDWKAMLEDGRLRIQSENEGTPDDR